MVVKDYCLLRCCHAVWLIDTNFSGECAVSIIILEES
jgi:hypothetical protein